MILYAAKVINGVIISESHDERYKKIMIEILPNIIQMQSGSQELIETIDGYIYIHVPRTGLFVFLFSTKSHRQDLCLSCIYEIIESSESDLTGIISVYNVPKHDRITGILSEHIPQRIPRHYVKKRLIDNLGNKDSNNLGHEKIEDKKEKNLFIRIFLISVLGICICIPILTLILVFSILHL